MSRDEPGQARSRLGDLLPWLDARTPRVLAWLIAPLVVILAYRNAAGIDFVGDARMLISDNRWMDGLTHFWDNLTHNYFWSSSGHLVPYWRPVTKGSWCLERQLFGDWAGGFALVQVGWHLLVVVGTQLLGCAWGLRRRLAIIAGLVVGLHPVAIPPVSMIMARSDVVATAAVLWSVLGWWHWRQRGARRRLWAAVHVSGVLLALGSKETAAALPALLTLWSLLEGDWRRNRRGTLWKLAPSWIATVSYLGLRTWLLGREAPGLQNVALGFDPLRIAACLTKYLENLWPLALSSSVRDVPVLEAHSAPFWMVGGATLLAAAVVAGFAVKRKDRVLLFGILWIAAALAPVLLTAKIHVPAIDEKFPMADRWLYHALPAATLGWARLIQLLKPVWLERFFQVATAGWALLMLIRSGPARAEFATEMGMLDNEDRAYYHATPPEFRTAQDHCRFHERRLERGLRRNDDEQLVAAFVGYRANCREISVGRWMQLLEALMRLDRPAEAKPVVERLLQAPPPRPSDQRRLARLAGTVFAQTAEPRRAERWLARARKLGDGDCRLLVMLAEAARATGDTTRAADRLEQAFVCGNERDPSLLLAAATWALEADARDRARALLQRLTARTALSPDQRGQLGYLRSQLDGDAAGPASAGVPVLRGR